jgi:hypothetical protein
LTIPPFAKNAKDGAPIDLFDRDRLEGKARGIPHIAKNERDAPNFLYAALERTACAPFIKERRMKFREPTKLHRKSGMWGTRRLAAGREPKNAAHPKVAPPEDRLHGENCRSLHFGRHDKERVVAYLGSCEWDVWISDGKVV